MRIRKWLIEITLENGEKEVLLDAPDWVAKPVDEYLCGLEANYKENLADSQINIIKDENNRGPE
jgi:hypothetical protein